MIVSVVSGPSSSPVDLGAGRSLTVSDDTVRFEAIYEAHFDFAWRSLRRLGVPPTVIEDAVQDLFVVVCRKLPGFEGRASIKTWLFSIAIRIAKEHIRRQARRRLDRLCPTPDRPRLPSDRAAEAEEVALLDRLLAELDEDRRAVFVMAELEEMTAPEIAEALGTNPNTVYTRLRAARRCFNEAFGRYRAERRPRDVSEGHQGEGGRHE